jgi:2'-5' RNA ligase
MKPDRRILRSAPALLALAMISAHASAASPARGLLFSAFLFERTPLAERWAAIRPEAEALFPAIKLKAVVDLHMTVVYIGADWDADKAAFLRREVTLPRTQAVSLTPRVAFFGRNDRVVAIELKGFPGDLERRVIELKKKLSAAGVKPPEAYDGSFRPHVTIAEARNSPPGPEEALQLDAFRRWVTPRLDPATLSIVLEAEMPIRWLLAAAPHPDPLREYMPLEAFGSGE